MPSKKVADPYETSKHVRAGMACAYSVLNNPRSLEASWNAPYNHTFHELFVSGSVEETFLIYSPYTMWIPSLLNTERDLRRRFAEAGLDFEKDDATAEREQRRANRAAVSRGGQSGPHQSSRRNDVEKKAEEAGRQIKNDLVSELLKERLSFLCTIEDAQKSMFSLFLRHLLQPNTLSQTLDLDPTLP